METKKFISSVIRATLLALIISLVGILVFAVLVKWTAPTETLIKTVNQFIKVLAVFIGCFFMVKGNGGLIKGALAGATSTLLIYAVFALMSGAPLFSAEMLIDVLLTAVVGGISGIVSVNLRGKE